MPMTTSTTWVCDRDGETVEVPAGEYPVGWRGVERFDPPSTETGQGRQYLCADCSTALQTFLAGP